MIEPFKLEYIETSVVLTNPIRARSGEISFSYKKRIPLLTFDTANFSIWHFRFSLELYPLSYSEKVHFLFSSFARKDEQERLTVESSKKIYTARLIGVKPWRLERLFTMNGARGKSRKSCWPNSRASDFLRKQFPETITGITKGENAKKEPENK